jgi:DNA-binding IclR family transcriptional regulator
MSAGKAARNPKPSPQRGVQSIEVGGRLLLALAEEPRPLTLKDLAHKAGLPASRAHPYLVSFGRLGMIEQDPVSGQYALGPAALQIGLSCLHQADAIGVATRVAQTLAGRIDQAVAIAVWANFGPTIVRLFEGRQPLHVSMRAGSVMSLFGTATGRAFAAVLPQATIDAVLAAHHVEGRRSDGSPVTDIALELAQIRSEFATHGLTRAVGRPIPGVNAFSAPAFDHQGNAAVVLTALGPDVSFASTWNSVIAKEMRSAAEEISRRLGYRDGLARA